MEHEELVDLLVELYNEAETIKYKILTIIKTKLNISSNHLRFYFNSEHSDCGKFPNDEIEEHGECYGKCKYKKH